MSRTTPRTRLRIVVVPTTPAALATRCCSFLGCSIEIYGRIVVGTGGRGGYWGRGERGVSIVLKIKNVRVAVTSKDLMKAKEALRIAIPKIDRAVNHGVMKKETASRNISRLT